MAHTQDGLPFQDGSDECWRVVAGYEGIYEISSHGRIRRVNAIGRYEAGRLLNPRLNQCGYPMVHLYDSRGRRAIAVHLLVARAFLGEPPADRPEVNHVDGRKTNSAAWNLEYVSHKGNMEHAVSTGLLRNRGERHGLSSMTREVAGQIVEAYRRGGVSHRVLAERFHVGETSIYRLLKGQTKYLD